LPAVIVQIIIFLGPSMGLAAAFRGEWADGSAFYDTGRPRHTPPAVFAPLQYLLRHDPKRICAGPPRGAKSARRAGIMVVAGAVAGAPVRQLAGRRGERT